MNNVVLGGITIYTKRVELNQGNQMVTITPPQTTQNQDQGKKDTLIVDLFRIEERFTVDGFIESDDFAAFKALITTKGTKTMTYRGTDYDVGIEKTSCVEDPEDKDDQTNSPAHFDVKVTLVVGKSFGS